MEGEREVEALEGGDGFALIGLVACGTISISCLFLSHLQSRLFQMIFPGRGDIRF